MKRTVRSGARRSAAMGALLAVAAATLMAALTGVRDAAGAEIRMEIVGPGSRLSAMAVAGLRNLGGDEDHRLSKDFVTTLRRDLRLSGYFRIIDPKAYIEQPATSGFELGTFNFTNWSSLGADFLVKGSVAKVGSSVDLTAMFYDVAQQRRMMGKRFSGAPSQVQRMARRFADAILEATTGRRGPFDSTLAFISTRGGRFKEVYTQSLDGRNLVRLTHDSTIDLFPSLDKSGRSLLYLSYKTGSAALYLADLQALRERRLPIRHGRVMGGVMTPDGKSVVAALENDGYTNLYLLDTRGRIKRPLTKSASINVGPAVSPDGRLLAFSSDRAGSPQIYVMQMGGGEARRVTYRGSYNTTPAFSPTGDRIAYQSRDGGRFDIYTISLSGGKPRRLTDGGGSNQSPAWSPDGRYIAFTSTRSGRSRVYLLLVSTGKIISALTEGRGNETAPAWSSWLGY